MLKIGEFARLCQVSVKTLRHYDALGLLQPFHIDPDTGYRLYDVDQLADMLRILALKDCGFALEEIEQIRGSRDTHAIEVLLRERVEAQQHLVAAEQARLQRLLARVDLSSPSSPHPPYDVVLKCTEPLTLVGVRQCIASRDAIETLVQDTLRRFERQALSFSGPTVHIYFSVEDEQLDLFVGAPVIALPATLSSLCAERFSGGECVACVLHRGDYATISRAYLALHRWLATSGYSLAGPCREIYHRSALHTADSVSFLTEIQLPIQAADA